MAHFNYDLTPQKKSLWTKIALFFTPTKVLIDDAEYSVMTYKLYKGSIYIIKYESYSEWINNRLNN